MELLIFAGIGFGICAIVWIAGKCSKASLYDALKPKIDTLDVYKQQLDQKQYQFDREVEQKNQELDQRQENIQVIAKLAKQKSQERQETILLIAKQKSMGFPWLAEAYADFYHLEEIQAARALEVKTHPAHKAAEMVRQAGERRRVAERKARLFEYQIKYYENLFPWLADLKSEDVEDELIKVSATPTDGGEDDDPVRQWLTQEEYRSLPNSKKFELALERYWTKKKTKWEIGRDYERYIGYLYEKDGNTVRYQGIIEGFDDLGRDLIVKRDNYTVIVQCKNWSQERVIHEKHIFQLYGTCIAYRYDHPLEVTTPCFVTSTRLSDRARGFAELLGVKFEEELPLKRYPCIKCHISKRTGAKIYHLPFDQQYDRTIIETDKGEYYLETIKDAEDRGFRRAFRYRGPQE